MMLIIHIMNNDLNKLDENEYFDNNDIYRNIK